MRKLFFTTLLALSVPAFAATPINETRPLSSTGQLQIENLKGRIQVRGWERDEVALAGSLGAGVEKLEISGDSARLTIKVHYPRNVLGSDKSEPTELLLNVPVKANLKIESVSAAVDVQGVAPAMLAIESVSGEVQVTATPARFKATSVSGALRLNVDSADVVAKNVSGEVLLNGRLDQISAENVSGRITITGNTQPVNKLSAQTVSGSVEVHTALAGNGQIELQSVSGNLLLTLPKDLSAHLNAKTMSGNLRAPDATVIRPKYGPGSSLDTGYGSGNGQIRFNTVSGNAQLRLE
jgi:DUF4097 and DUF4098 domain-containing protein YvlB